MLAHKFSNDTFNTLNDIYSERIAVGIINIKAETEASLATASSSRNLNFWYKEAR